MFEATLNVIAAKLGIPTDEQAAQGAGIEVNLTLGMALPFAQSPGGPPVQTPAAEVKYMLDRDAAEQFFKAGLEAVEKLPKPSRLEVASSMDGIDQAAQNLAKLSGQDNGKT